MQIKILVDNNTIIDSYYLGEPAVSYFIVSENKKILFDVGYSDIFIKNARKMGIDISNLDNIVISHGHNDHTGGFIPLIKYYKRKVSSCKKITKHPIIIAHPEAFSYKIELNQEIGCPVNLNSLSQVFKIHLSDIPVWITEKIVFLGEIERSNSFENQTPIGHRIFNKSLIDDYVPDDSAIAYKSKDGLVIVTGCSHSGICNIIEYAKKVCNENRIIDVIGGFHLLNSNTEQQEKTISYLENLGVREIHPCHCTSLQSKIDLSRHVTIKDIGVGQDLFYD